MTTKKPLVARQGHLSDAEFMALAEEYLSRPGRRLAWTKFPGAGVVKALVDRHGVRQIDGIRAVLAVRHGTHDAASATGRARERALEEACRKQKKAGLVSFASDKGKFMQAVLTRLFGVQNSK